MTTSQKTKNNKEGQSITSSKRKTMLGIVTSTKMKDTVVVKTVTRTWHPLYKKQMTKFKKFKAHNDLNSKHGDTVKIMETKPYSASVHFKVVEIIKNVKA